MCVWIEESNFEGSSMGKKAPMSQWAIIDSIDIKTHQPECFKYGYISIYHA